MATGRQQQQQQQHGEPDNDDDESFDMKAVDQFEYIRFTMTDMNGIGRCLSVPRRHAEHCLHEGLGFYAGKYIFQTCHSISLKLMDHQCRDAVAVRVDLSVDRLR